MLWHEPKKMRVCFTMEDMSSNETEMELSRIVYFVWQKKEVKAGNSKLYKNCDRYIEGLDVERDPLLLFTLAVSEWACVSDRKKPYNIMLYYVKKKEKLCTFPIYGILIFFQIVFKLFSQVLYLLCILFMFNLHVGGSVQCIGCSLPLHFC